MSIVNSEAFLLNYFKYGDTSIIAKFFSYEFGKFSGLIKGARNIKHGKSAIYQTMNHLVVFFNKKENRDLQFISKSDLINSFPGIKSNLDKLNISYRMLELINSLSIEYDKNKDLFVLLKNSLLKTDSSESNLYNILIYFQIKTAEYTGISLINIDKFNKFMISDETFENYSSLKIIDDFMDIIYYINFANLDTLDKINIKENISVALIGFLDKYLLGDDGNFYLKTKRSFEQINRKI